MNQLPDIKWLNGSDGLSIQSMLSVFSPWSDWKIDSKTDSMKSALAAMLWSFPVAMILEYNTATFFREMA